MLDRKRQKGPIFFYISTRTARVQACTGRLHQVRKRKRRYVRSNFKELEDDGYTVSLYDRSTSRGVEVVTIGFVKMSCQQMPGGA